MDRGGFIRAVEREGLDRFPDNVDDEDLVGCFTLSGDDLDFVRSRRGRAGRLAGGVQIGALRLLGFIPEEVGAAPAPVVAFVADQLHVDPGVLSSERQGWRDRSQVEVHCGFRRADGGDLKRLNDWLGDRAIEHDQPWALFRSGCGWLRSERVVRVGVTVMERAVMSARARAIERTYLVLASQLDAETRSDLDGLVVVGADGNECGLTLLRRAPTGRVAAQINALLDRLEMLEASGGFRFDVSGLSPNRVRFLASLGRRMSPSAIARLSSERRFQILVATVVELTERTIDQIVDLFDVGVTALNRPPDSAS